MPPLPPHTTAALGRLRTYVPPPTTWYSLPLSRRAAVLILLFADSTGDLRVVLTMRAATLSSYAGQAALPGGKSDSLAETPAFTARREASEEVGLPMGEFAGMEGLKDSSAQSSASATPQDTGREQQQPTLGQSRQGKAKSRIQDPSLTVLPTSLLSTKYTPPTPTLPKPYTIEHLCQLPTNLAKTELGVRPVVAYLSANSQPAAETAGATAAAGSGPGSPSADLAGSEGGVAPDIESTLLPRLDAQEVAAVFSAPLRNFLHTKDLIEPPKGTEGEWYKGVWTDWHETKFRMHNFFVPVLGRAVSRPRKRRAERERGREGKEREGGKERGLDGSGGQGGDGRSKTAAPYPKDTGTLPYAAHPQPSEVDPLDTQTRYRVFGMTARILVDCARIAYGEEPEFEHNVHYGDEGILGRLIESGRMEGERGREDEIFPGDLAKVLGEKGEGFGGLVKGQRREGGSDGKEGRGKL